MSTIYKISIITVKELTAQVVNNGQNLVNVVKERSFKERSSTVQKRCFLGVNSLHLEACMGCRFYGERTCYRHTTYLCSTQIHGLFDTLCMTCSLIAVSCIRSLFIGELDFDIFLLLKIRILKIQGFKFQENISRYHLISKR